jgi:sugar diacid utilization regulator
VEAVVLERAVMAARTVLDRTRSRTGRPHRRDDELLEVLLDATAPDRDRMRAAQILGLPLDGRARVVASVDGRLDVEAVPETAAPGHDSTARAGIGPAVPPMDLPWTVEQARAAVRFTAEGTAIDPGPRVVHAEDLGGLLLLAHAIDGHPESIPDLLAIEKAVTAAPWVLPTLDVVAGAASLRAAATTLHVHHSTLQERLGQAERLLGWSLREVPGIVRLNVALVLRRIHRNRARA